MSKKYAVILYGFMRTYKKTSASLLNNIVEKNGADLFIYCYDNEGRSPLSNNADINNAKRIYGNAWDSEGQIVTESSLHQQYGDKIKKISINRYEIEKFISDSRNIYSPILQIERCYSLYYNISNSVKMFNEYCSQHKIKYDGVLITRGDLMFYEEIDFNFIDLSKITVPVFGGNPRFGEEQRPYYVCYYKNVTRGELIQWNKVVFSDQFMLSSQQNISRLEQLYDLLSEYNSRGIPICHPETVLYYHLSYSAKINHDAIDICYEILRDNSRDIENEIQIAFPLKAEAEAEAEAEAKAEVSDNNRITIHKIVTRLMNAVKIVFNK
ncbi:hypothetical protein A8607_004437 [Escherichia coli]|nr:hypothetical protein [Escherichia coli]